MAVELPDAEAAFGGDGLGEGDRVREAPEPAAGSEVAEEALEVGDFKGEDFGKFRALLDEGGAGYLAEDAAAGEFAPWGTEAGESGIAVEAAGLGVEVPAEGVGFGGGVDEERAEGGGANPGAGFPLFEAVDDEPGPGLEEGYCVHRVEALSG